MRIDISERKLYIEENGDQVASYSVAVGTGAHPTPRGAFTVQRVIWNPRWVPPEAKWAEDERPREPGDPKNPMGRVKIFFREPDYTSTARMPKRASGRRRRTGVCGC
jgi:lipoprotein-anchoring transpeptidase ErfK/SrfK